MVKTFKTSTSVKKFLMEFASHMDFMNDTVLITNDMGCDLAYSFKEWINHGCQFPFKIYIRQHGTFNNWSSGEHEIDNLLKYWSDQMIGVITINKNNGYSISFDYTQYMPFA